MLYKISLEPYLEDSYYGIFLDRRNQDIDFVRKTCVLILKEKNLEKILNKSKVCKEDLFLNPIMFLEPEYYQKDDLPWDFIRNLEMDVSIIENWAFKSEQVPFPAKGILFNVPWMLSLSDSKLVYDLKYSRYWSNLDYFKLYPYGAINFRIALEICRIKNIEYEIGIKNFKEAIITHGVLLSIVNHVELVDVFVNLPIEKRGQLQNDQLQSLELNEINYDQEYFYGKASGIE